MKNDNSDHQSLNYKTTKTPKGIEYKYVENEKYIIIPIETEYIEANDSLDSIINPAIDIIEENDYLVIAETPVAISEGRLVDETEYDPGISAKFLAIIWSKYIWGYILGPLFGIKKRTIKNLRKLPPETVRHKEVILRLYGWKHALKPASEAGVDLSNAPGTFVSLLPFNPQKTADKIAEKIQKARGFFPNVLIIDTDATYKRGKKYFTGLPIAIEGINSDNGVFAYILGQLSTNAGSTPLGSSKEISVEKAIKIANIAESYQKALATNMETIYSAKNILKSNIDDISVETLNSIVHTPAVIVRENNIY
jgi:F420-0:gamma-glutamyl ligase-like protein